PDSHLLRLLLWSVPSFSQSFLQDFCLRISLFKTYISFGASLSCLTLTPLSRGESVCGFSDHFTVFFKLSWSPDRVRIAQLAFFP
uniref:Uncharacterized protein n=1 Tax=Triticum urartu TaxID=4572 RepID=A0A8R7UVT2_TRIUA